MAKSKIAAWKKIALTGAAAATLGLGFWASKAFYTVKEVTDGDTFVTTERQVIRFDSINAPELNLCLGKEAKAELERLVLGKKVFLKVSYLQGYRQVASVYTIQGNVGAKMLEKGLATFEDKGSQKNSGLLGISQKAREKGVGVYSEKCTQKENPINPKCNIKANVGQLGNIYHYPGCRGYNMTIVQLHFGDKWFCTEKEAKAAGFTKGTDCP